jgi:hypothetical protein
MRKTLLITILLCSITALFAQQPVFPYKNTFSMSPFGLFSHIFMTGYERGFKNNQSIVLSAGLYSNGNGITIGNMDYDIEGYLGELQYRNYFICNQGKNHDKIWNRLFFAPYAFFRYYEFTEMKEDNSIVFEKNPDIKYQINSYGGGLLLGYALSIQRFSFEAYMGGGIKLSDHNLSPELEDKYTRYMWSLAFKGVVPRVGFNIGFSF